MLPADLESLEETIAILADREAMQRLAASEAEVAAGLGESAADLAPPWRSVDAPRQRESDERR